MNLMAQECREMLQERLRSCYAKHKDLFEEIISEVCNDVEDLHGLKIAVTGSSGSQWPSRARYTIGSGWTEAWSKMAGYLETKVVELLESNSNICRLNACNFCDHHFFYVHLKVKSGNMEDVEIVHFKIKKTSQLQRLMDVYCARQHLAADKVHFLFDGDELSGTSTPGDLNMKHDDVIDATHLDKQEGGNGSAGAGGRDNGAD